MDNGPSDNKQSSDLVLRILASLGLILSTISGGYTVSTTDDRIRASEVTAQLEKRDIQISHLRQQLEQQRAVVERIDRYGPAVGNKALLEEVKEMDSRLDDIEKRRN